MSENSNDMDNKQIEEPTLNEEVTTPIGNNEESEGNPTFTAQDPRFQESMSELVANIYENLDK